METGAFLARLVADRGTPSRSSTHASLPGGAAERSYRQRDHRHVDEDVWLRRGEPAHERRFQVQWEGGKYGDHTFSVRAFDRYDEGVSKLAAQTALTELLKIVEPTKVRKSRELEGAFRQARNYIRQSPGVPQGESKSFYLVNGDKPTLGGQGARVDVVSDNSPFNLTRPL